MLVRLEDAEGRETWINPIHVKVLRTRKGMLGNGRTEVWFSFHHTSEAVYFSESPAEIAAAINAAMPQVIALEASGDEPPSHTPSAG